MSDLIKYHPRKTWAPLLDFHRDIDNLFDSFFAPFAHGSLKDTAWSPAVDVYEDDDKFTLSAELPGMTEKDIRIDIENNTLTIQGERKQEKEVKKGRYHKVERTYGAFCRSFQLPSNVKADKIKARYKDGLLEVTLPKVEESKPKRIEVKVDK